MYLDIRYSLVIIFFFPTKAPGGQGGQRKIQQLQGVRSGAVGSTGGRGKETCGAGRCSGEWKVGQITSLPAKDFSCCGVHLNQHAISPPQTGMS